MKEGSNWDKNHVRKQREEPKDSRSNASPVGEGYRLRKWKGKGGKGERGGEPLKGSSNGFLSPDKTLGKGTGNDEGYQHKVRKGSWGRRMFAWTALRRLRGLRRGLILSNKRGGGNGDPESGGNLEKKKNLGGKKEKKGINLHIKNDLKWERGIASRPDKERTLSKNRFTTRRPRKKMKE